MVFSWRWIENILLVLIIILALFIGDNWARWVIALAAVVLVVERFIARTSKEEKSEPFVKMKTSTRKKRKKR